MAVAAVRGDRTLVELAEQFKVHPNQIGQWRAELLERAAEVFATTGDERDTGRDWKARCTPRSASRRWRLNGRDVPAWQSARADVTMRIPFTSDGGGGQMSGMIGVVAVLGIDLAKRVFALHGVDASGKPILKQVLSRSALTKVIAQLQRCLIGLEACSGAHGWARQFRHRSPATPRALQADILVFLTPLEGSSPKTKSWPATLGTNEIANVSSLST